MAIFVYFALFSIYIHLKNNYSVNKKINECFIVIGDIMSKH